MNKLKIYPNNRKYYSEEFIQGWELGIKNQFDADVDFLEDLLDKIRAEIAEYKDDKVIHAEQNEMIDIVLEILDKYR